MAVVTIIFTSLVALLVTAIVIFDWRHDTWKRKNVPHTRPLPIFGNFFKTLIQKETILDGVHRVYTKFYNEPFAGFYVLSSPVLLLKDPDLIKDAFITNFEHFTDHSLMLSNTFDSLLSRVLFCQKGKAWKNLRAKLNPAFTSNRLRAMFPKVGECSKNLIECIEENRKRDKNFEIVPLLSRYGVDVIASCAFGCDAESLKDPDGSLVFKTISDVFSFSFWQGLASVSGMFSPMLYQLMRIPMMPNWRLENLLVLLEQAAKHRDNVPSHEKDIFDVVLDLRQHSDISKDEFVSQVMQMNLAGSETTATTITFTLWLLARHQDVQERVRDEIMEVIKNGTDITYDSIREFKYLDMVTKEVLRLWPVMGWLDRRCTKNYRIPGTDVVLKKGDNMTVSIYSVQRDPKYWSSPDTFDPERFRQEGSEKENYYPFGIGPRTCIGARFGVTNVKCTVAKLLSRYRILLGENCAKCDEELVFNKGALFFNLKSDCLKLRFDQF